MMSLPRPGFRAAASLAATLLGLGLAGTGCAADAPHLGEAFEQQVKPFLASYCTDCHGGKKPKGDLDLTPFTSGAAALAKVEIWKDAAKRVRGQDMPPLRHHDQDIKQPSESGRTQFI